MNTLKIDLENCFGIGKLCHTFDFSRNSISLIYAPNGTMKTSFAKTFDVISKNDPKCFLWTEFINLDVQNMKYW